MQIAVPETKRAKVVKRFVGRLTCPKAFAEVTAERALLEFLDGSCQTPISASATIDEIGYLPLDGMILLPDGSESYRQQMRAPSDQASTLGSALGAELLGLAGVGSFCFDYGKYTSVVVKLMMLCC